MTQKHFTDELWSDYVRGVSPAPDAAAIHQHLEAGCEPCERSFRFWRTVAEIANSEACNEVPEAQMRISQAAYVSWWRGQMLPERAIMRVCCSTACSRLSRPVCAAKALRRAGFWGAPANGHSTFGLSLRPVRSCFYWGKFSDRRPLRPTKQVSVFC